MNSTIFSTETKQDFVIKLHYSDKEEPGAAGEEGATTTTTTTIRRVRLARLASATNDGEISYEKLQQLAQEFSKMVDEDVGSWVELTYQDSDNDRVLIDSDEELLDAMEQFVDAKVLRIQARRKGH